MFASRPLLVVVGLSLGLAAPVRCGEPVRLIHGDLVFGVVFAPDGRSLFSVSDDHTVRAWDVSTGKETRRFVGHTAGVLAVALSGDGKTLATAGRDGTVRVWETRTGKLLHILSGLVGDVEAVALSSDGTRLAASSSGRSGMFRVPLADLVLT